MLHAGIIFRLKHATTDDAVELAPITVFPSPFPRECFELAKAIQPDVNLLMHKIAHDYDFLSASLARVIHVDDFTRRLMAVHEKVLRHGTAQDTKLGMLRADYMLDVPTGGRERLRQIEVNVIAAGFAIMGPKLTRFHRHVISKYRTPGDVDRCLPLNHCDTNFAQAFVNAWLAYGNPQAVMLVVVEDRTINLSDQRSMDFVIAQLRPDLKIVRRSFTQLVSTANLLDNNRLIIDNNYEVALVYFRYGYSPEHYVTDDYWELRFKVEISKAIKCPSLGYHLAGVKKVQQILCQPNTVEKFLDESAARRVRETFAGIWSMDRGEEGDKIVDMVLHTPEDYVLKPQREGGSNNIYGADIRTCLEPIRDSELREAYIAMERIRPPVMRNLLVSPRTEPHYNTFNDIDSELGIFGSILGDSNNIVSNLEAGHVLRSKLLHCNEGGVSSGNGVIDSPYLY